MRRTPHHTAYVFARANYLLGKRCLELCMPINALMAFEAAGSLVSPADWVELADLLLAEEVSTVDRQNAAVCFRRGKAPQRIADVIGAALRADAANEAFILLEDMGADAPAELWVALGDLLGKTRPTFAAAAYFAGGATEKVARIAKTYPSWREMTGEYVLSPVNLTTERWAARITGRPITPAGYRTIGRRALREKNCEDAYEAFVKAGALVTPPEWRRLAKAMMHHVSWEKALECAVRSGDEKLIRNIATYVLKYFSLQEAIPCLRTLSPESLHISVINAATEIVKAADDRSLPDALELCADAGVQPRHDEYQAWGKHYLGGYMYEDAARCFLLARDVESFQKATDLAIKMDSGWIDIFRRIAREEDDPIED